MIIQAIKINQNHDCDEFSAQINAHNPQGSEIKNHTTAHLKNGYILNLKQGWIVINHIIATKNQIIYLLAIVLHIIGLSQAQTWYFIISAGISGLEVKPAKHITPKIPPKTEPRKTLFVKLFIASFYKIKIYNKHYI